MADLRHPSRQCGTAIITALLVVMLAASIAAFLLAQQSHALTRTARANERAQATLLAQPMLQWARAALFEFQKNSSSVDLTQRWAQPIGAQPIEGAMATGFFRDETGKFNVNNLIGVDGKKSEADARIFAQLLADAGLNPELTFALADWIDKDDETSFPGGAEDANYLALPQPYRAANQRMMQIEELYAVKGFDAATLTKLRPFITALPDRTKININTAPDAVLAAALPGLSKEKRDELLARRMTQPFTTFDGEKGIRNYLKELPPAVEQSLGFDSGYFSISLGVNAGGTQLRQSALLQRVTPNGPNTKPVAWPRIIWLKDD